MKTLLFLAALALVSKGALAHDHDDESHHEDHGHYYGEKKECPPPPICETCETCVVCEVCPPEKSCPLPPICAPTEVNCDTDGDGQTVVVVQPTRCPACPTVVADPVYSCASLDDISALLYRFHLEGPCRLKKDGSLKCGKKRWVLVDP